MRPHAGGPARVWTDDTLARVREALGRHRTIAAAASELGIDADADHVSVTAEVVNDAAMIPLLTVLGFKDLGQRMWSLHVPLR